MSKRRKKRSLAIWSGCDWLPMIEVHRSGKTVLYGCKSMSEFSDECMGFSTPEGEIMIYGPTLTLLDYCDETAVISGKILRIELIGGINR